MIDEENKEFLGNDYQSSKEYLNNKEYSPEAENITAQESIKQDEFLNDSYKTPPKKKNTVFAKIGGGLVVIVAAAMIGVTNLINVEMNANFIDEQMSYRDGAMYYAINVENMTDKENLTLHWSENNKELETFDIIDEDGDGIVEGMIDLSNQNIEERLNNDPDLEINYSFTLKGLVGLSVIRKFDNYDLKIQYAEATVRDIYRQCNCGTTGYYNFQIDFDDPYGTFYDWSAYIETESGDRSDCIWTENKHEMQQIYVMNLNSMKGKLVIDWKSGIQENPTYHYEFDVQF